MKKLCFTDLDGTLLDHHTYRADAALEALNLLKQQDIPLVFCSSKTFAEQVRIREALGVEAPFIVENGSAVILPADSPLIFSTPSETASPGYAMIRLSKITAADIRATIQAVNSRFHLNICGFTQSDNTTVAQHTQLTGSAVSHARERWFTDTLLPFDDLPQMHAMFDDAGMVLSQGGRFLTVQDKNVSKGRAVKLVTDMYAAFWGETPVTSAFGDSMNDQSMLEAVDYPYLVQRPDTTWAEMNLPRLTRVPAVGPRGFSMAVAGI